MNDDQDAESSEENNESNNWVEAVAFCKDPTFPVAATGTIHGDIFIWDILKQVLLPFLLEYNFSFEASNFYRYLGT